MQHRATSKLLKILFKNRHTIDAQIKKRAKSPLFKSNQWCACVVLNHGPPACQAGALPLSYRRISLSKVILALKRLECQEN